MVGNCDRRFLTLPAMRPCQEVSPAVIVHDLAALGRDIQILHRSASFPTHRRSGREAVREVGALLEFFDAVRDRDPSLLPGSAFLGLSELHVAFQKLRHLLRDCGLRGAPLWVLMTSGRVSDEFRILVRSIATALDVLPLAAIDAPGEVKEVVRLVAEQARRVVIGTDPADAAAAGEVCKILGRVEKGVDPDPGRLEGVLRHLRIRTWTECDEEIVFLEGELGATLSSKGEQDEIMLLSSLRGLMNYARSAFRCPISLELMSEPVTIATGHTYDRASIGRWLASGNDTCPVTGKRLMSHDFVPNFALGKLIRRLCQERNIPIAEPCKDRHGFRKSSIPSPAAAGATRVLCDLLVNRLSDTGSAHKSSKIVYEVRLLAKSSLFDRVCLVEAGAVPRLLFLLSSPDPHTQADAMAAVLCLSKHPKGRKSVFESSGLHPIVQVLRRGLTTEAQQNAAATVFYLSAVEEDRREIGEMPEAIPALVALLQRESIRGKKNAAVALFGLLLVPGNHRKVLAAGAVSILIEQLSSDREDLVGDCLAVLAALAESPEGTYAILHHHCCKT
ncbi:hypothetical protein Taro_022315, partial [Colocasia esculenta]|nr:hypothetical protein [Colocasia esculenta]